MADPSTCLPLTPDSIRRTHERIKPYIHQTPLLTCRSLDAIASHPNPRSFLSDNPPSVWEPAAAAAAAAANPGSQPPKFRLYFKMENTQVIGAFKPRGAFSAITHLAAPPSPSPSDDDTTTLPGGIGIDELRARGVVTHSSGNHAQALALAASTLGVPATVVMPAISTKSKISGTRNTPGVEVVFSGPTAPEREEAVRQVVERKRQQQQQQQRGKNGGTTSAGPVFVPPYDHPDIILGQGTAGYEMEMQFRAMKKAGSGSGSDQHQYTDEAEPRFDAVLTPLGGGGLLSGTATWFSHTHTHHSTNNNTSNTPKRTLVFGTEPSFQNANDGERGLARSPPTRITHVRSLTIADGLRTPVGELPWSIIANTRGEAKGAAWVKGVYSTDEKSIKMALKLLVERMKVVVEPSSAVPLAVVLFNDSFRGFVAREQQQQRGENVWDVGIVISGGNTTVEALARLFREGWLDEEDDEGKGKDDNVAG